MDERRTADEARDVDERWETAERAVAPLAIDGEGVPDAGRRGGDVRVAGEAIEVERKGYT